MKLESRVGVGERKLVESGFGWLGCVPESWALERLQWHIDEINEKNTDGKVTTVLSLTNDRGVIPYEEKGNQGNKSKENLTEYKIAYKNTIVANSMNILIGSVGLSRYDGCVSPVYYVFKPKSNSDLGFLNYLFQMREFQRELRRYANGILEIRLRVSSSDIMKRICAFPPLAEQQRIAAFLDRECEKIDGLRGKIEKQIEKLDELKKSTITEAVTGKIGVGGRCRSRKMKPSGVEWIGNIPEEWKTAKVIHGLKMPLTDGPHTTPNLYPDGVPFVSAEAVSCGNGRIDFDHIRGYISEEFYEECSRKYVPQIDDVYIIKSGATTGRVAIVDTTERFTIWSPLAAYRVDKEKLNARFLFYSLQSDSHQKQVEQAWSFGTQQNIGMRVLERLKIAFPPLAEQKEIAEYLDKKCAAIDAAKEKCRVQLDKLAEYKKSLIYEYVTGKRSVFADEPLRRDKEVA